MQEPFSLRHIDRVEDQMTIKDHDRTPGATTVPQLSEPTVTKVGVAQRVIAVHEDHHEAQRTVQTLTEGGLPAERTAVVGRGLTFVEQGTGRLSTAEVTRRGAVSGLVIGGLTGSLLGVFNLVTPSVATWWLAVNAAVLGAVLGAVTALLGYVITHGHRTFATAPNVTASHYDVLVDAELADQAVRMLNTGKSTPEPG
jgi:hypothetical protein